MRHDWPVISRKCHDQFRWNVCDRTNFAHIFLSFFSTFSFQKQKITMTSKWRENDAIVIEVSFLVILLTASWFFAPPVLLLLEPERLLADSFPFPKPSMIQRGDVRGCTVRFASYSSKSISGRTRIPRLDHQSSVSRCPLALDHVHSSNLERVIPVNVVRRPIWPVGPASYNRDRSGTHPDRTAPVRLLPHARLHRLRVLQETK